MADTNSNIDVLVAIDSDTILSVYGNGGSSPSSPKPVDNSYIYMIVAQDDALSGNAGGELNISASNGDNIRWRETTLSMNFNTSVVFAEFSTQQTSLITSPELVGGFPPDGDVETELEPQPVQGTPPWSAKETSTPYHFWQATAESPGTVTYHWVFQIFNSDGTSAGYYSWDPFITITDPTS